MNEQNNHRLALADYLILPLVMALAFYLAFLPHYNYPYPVHVDEWLHMAYSNAMVQAGSTNILNPFSGESTIDINANLEAGFHLFWAVFYQISGIPWITIFKYFPAIIFMLTTLSVYVLAQREGFGWEAALFTCLIPTTVGILGPGFLVPVAMGLLFLPLSIFLFFNLKNVWSYLAVFIFVSFSLLIHAPTAIGLVIILIPYILLNLTDNFKHSLGIALALAIPFLAPFPWIFRTLLPTAKGLLVSQSLPKYVELPLVVQNYGYLPAAFCLLGVFVLVMMGGKKSYSLILGLLALLLVLVAFFTFHYGISIMYERGLMYMMLLMSIVAGAGLMGVKNLSLPGPFLAQNTGKILCLVLVGVMLFMAIPDRQDIPYYHMIDEEDYQAFVWIRDNVDASYKKAILDPWKASAFSAVVGKTVFTRIHAFPTDKDDKANNFLRDGCRDTAFMKKNGISIVYTREECNNPDLIKVRENVYLLKKG